MDNPQSDQRTPPRFSMSSEAVARMLVPTAILAVLFVPVATVYPPAAFAAFGACFTCFAIFQFVRWLNWRDASRNVRRPFDDA